VQLLDWAARALSLIGLIGLGWLLRRRGGHVQAPTIDVGMLSR